MTYAESAFFNGEPVQHCADWLDHLLHKHRQKQMRQAWERRK